MNGNAATAKDGAEFGGGGAETPAGEPDGDGVVEPEGAGLVELEGGGVEELEGGVAPADEGAGAEAGPDGGLAGAGVGDGVAAVPVTLMASFWPSEQC